MAIRSGIFYALQETLLKQSLKATCFKLPTHEATYMCIRPNGQIVQVLSGNAWITCNGEDILLEAGQETQLPHDQSEAIISAIGSASVTFEITQQLGKG